MHLVAAWDWRRRSGSSGCSSSLPSSLWSPTTIPVSWSSKLRETGLLIDDIYSIMCYNILIWWYIVNICKNELYTLYDNIILYIYDIMTIIWWIHMHCTVTGYSHDIFFQWANESVRCGKGQSMFAQCYFPLRFDSTLITMKPTLPVWFGSVSPLFPNFLTCNHWSEMFWSNVLKWSTWDRAYSRSFRGRFNVFITMNPGYASTLATGCHWVDSGKGIDGTVTSVPKAGRSELPDNLAALFRPMAQAWHDSNEEVLQTITPNISKYNTCHYNK